MFASLDVLTGGRMICGVGVGWLEEEFNTLGVPYAQRGPISDEFLQIIKVLWTEPEPEFHGRFLQHPGYPVLPQAGAAAAHTNLGRRAHSAGIEENRQVRRLLAHHPADSRFRGPESALPAGADGEGGARPGQHFGIPEAQPLLHRPRHPGGNVSAHWRAGDGNHPGGHRRCLLLAGNWV